MQAIHDDLLVEHGGMPGLRDAGLLESALGRARFRWAYREARDVFDCAAAYGFGIARNHPFNDGNKRTAFQTMYAFLRVSGIEVTATEPDTVALMLGVADGSVSEASLAEWLRRNSERVKKPITARKAPRRHR